MSHYNNFYVPCIHILNEQNGMYVGVCVCVYMWGHTHLCSLYFYFYQYCIVTWHFKWLTGNKVFSVSVFVCGFIMRTVDVLVDKAYRLDWWFSGFFFIFLLFIPLLVPPSKNSIPFFYFIFFHFLFVYFVYNVSNIDVD